MFENELDEIRAYSKDSEYILKLKKPIEDKEVDGIVKNYRIILGEIETKLKNIKITPEDILKIKYSMTMEEFLQNKLMIEVFYYEERKNIS